MGNLLDKLSHVSQSVRGLKRKRSDKDDGESGDGSDLLDQSLTSPKRKKLTSTAKYIYQALFKEERNSDITVHALGKMWHLHKVYLSQSPYFASMFNGSWREADEEYVHIEIIDPKITIDSLFSVFGSLYMDEVVLEPKDIVSTLATATLFQLDGLIDRCAEVMVETTNTETAVLYYNAACEYGVKMVKQYTFGWLLVNLLSNFQQKAQRLRSVSVELMEQLVASADLYVVQTEFSLYALLRYWMLLKLFPSEPASDGLPDPARERYFSERTNPVPFLHTPEGAPFVRVFRALRLRNLLNHHVDVRFIHEDNIIPPDWLHKPLLRQWCSVLAIDQSLDKEVKCDERTFLETCIRCGRVIPENISQRWRWTGFHYGLDLLLLSDTRTLRIKRHHRTEHERLLSLQVKRQFLIRVSLAALNELGQIKHQQITPIQSVSLEKNEETLLAVFDRELTFPLLVSVNMLLDSPPAKRDNSPAVATPDEVPKPTEPQQAVPLPPPAQAVASSSSATAQHVAPPTEQRSPALLSLGNAGPSGSASLERMALVNDS
ncbi:protein germ cell-less [Anopheles bellator]|uniref:protein germ cell-less n=1 Tax=Anopheles bellator TaxID=139047 RepID=UPI0026471FBB|nr:protein germ cell-less [Anopheles bellator]